MHLPQKKNFCQQTLSTATWAFLFSFTINEVFILMSLPSHNLSKKIKTQHFSNSSKTNLELCVITWKIPNFEKSTNSTIKFRRSKMIAFFTQSFNKHFILKILELYEQNWRFFTVVQKPLFAVQKPKWNFEQPWKEARYQNENLVDSVLSRLTNS